MSVRVHLPPILRTLAGGARTLKADGSTIGSVLADLSEKHPAIARHLFDEAGFLRPSIVFLHDGNLVRASEATAHSVHENDEIVMTNALSGGGGRGSPPYRAATRPSQEIGASPKRLDSSSGQPERAVRADDYALGCNAQFGSVEGIFRGCKSCFKEFRFRPECCIG